MRWEGKQTDPFYKTAAWLHLRVRVLDRDHWWCQVCKRRPASTVHHKRPISEYPELALDEENCEAICAVCHNREHPEKGGPGKQGAGMPAGIRVIEIK